MRIIPLGVGGFIPTQGRETSSILAIHNRSAVLFDTGTGAKRLAESPVRAMLEDVDRLYVTFSHYHHDHTAGFTWLLRLWPGEISLRLPSAPLLECDGPETIGELTSPPLFALPAQKWPNIGDVEAVSTDGFEIPGASIRVLGQVHSGGSVGFRMERFAYITDTDPDGRHVEFTRGCDLVLMDTMHDQSDCKTMGIDDDKRGDHGNSFRNALVARDASISRLGLIHIDPLYEPQRVDGLLAEARQVFPQAFLPIEGTCYEVSE